MKTEQQQRRRRQFKIAVWAIVAANVALLVGLLIQGCRREPPTGEAAEDQTPQMGSPDTNAAPLPEQASDTNLPVPPSFEVPATNPVVEASTNAAPAPAPAGGQDYTVVKGDSLYKIAKANGVSLQALEAANPGVDSAKLKIGQVVHLPAGAQTSTASAVTSATHTTATDSPSSGRYVVKPRDTLGRIARTHHTTVKALKAANGLTSDRIVVGRSLKLPQSRVATASAIKN